jgi:hypothetical protein
MFALVDLIEDMCYLAHADNARPTLLMQQRQCELAETGELLYWSSSTSVIAASTCRAGGAANWEWRCQSAVVARTARGLIGRKVELAEGR